MRLRDLPRKFLVRDQEYQVKFVRRFPAKAGTAPLDGYCDPEEQILFVRQGLSPKDRLSTLIHELLHAVDDEWGIGLDHAMVYKLEEALTHLFLCNLD